MKMITIGSKEFLADEVKAHLVRIRDTREMYAPKSEHNSGRVSIPNALRSNKYIELVQPRPRENGRRREAELTDAGRDLLEKLLSPTD